ncbi:MAG: molybdate ABC transporter substrate-binding protein [Aquificae bacterium]|nr:molybdate ABC transporter substrate-binding protein [Aquificota bacterium]
MVVILVLVLTFSVVANALTIASAANVQFAVKELINSYKKSYPNVEIKTVVASSGKLTAQILRKAPYDVFLSADMKYPLFLYRKGFTVGKPKVYAEGRLVLWTTKEIPLKGIDTLKEGFIKKVAMANPKTAPYGRASLEVLKNTGLYKYVKGKLVYGESIAQTSQYIYKGLVDIGFTAKSVVLSPEVKGKGKWVEIDKKLHSPIKQAVVILKNGSDLQQAKRFVEFLLSTEGKKILQKYGYQ